MISYGGVDLQIPGAEEAAFIASQIPIADAFGFFRPRHLGRPALDLDPRPTFNWFLSKPIRLNVLTQPWGASRFGHAFVLADADMLAAIQPKNSAGQSLLLRIDDSLGGFISTPMFQLPAVPLAKILNIAPQCPLWLLPLADERLRWWERAAAITVTEGVTTWTDLYAALASALGTAITVDPISADYLFPGNGFTQSFQHIPLLLDLCASSVGQRIVRRLDGSIHALNASTAQALQVAQANANRKYAGGALNLGQVDA